MGRCSVLSCQRRKYLHRFPKHDIELMVKWLKLIDRDDLLLTSTPEIVYKNHHVCDLHFTGDDKYQTLQGEKLKHGSLPSAYLKASDWNEETTDANNAEHIYLQESNKILVNSSTQTDIRPSTQQTNQVKIGNREVKDVPNYAALTQMQKRKIVKEASNEKKLQLPIRTNTDKTTAHSKQLMVQKNMTINSSKFNISNAQKASGTNILQKVTKEEIIKQIQQQSHAGNICAQHSSNGKMLTIIDKNIKGKTIDQVCETVKDQPIIDRMPIVRENSASISTSCTTVNANQSKVSGEIIKGDALKNIKQNITPPMIQNSLNQKESHTSMGGGTSTNRPPPNQPNILRKVSKAEVFQNIAQKQRHMIKNESMKQSPLIVSMSDSIGSSNQSAIKPTLLRKTTKNEELKNIDQPQVPEDSSDQNQSGLSIPLLVTPDGTFEAEPKILKRVSKEDVLKNIKQTQVPIVIDSSEQNPCHLLMPAVIASNGTSEAEPKILKRVSKEDVLKNIKQTQAPIVMEDSSEQNPSCLLMPPLIANNGTSEAVPKILKRVSKEEVLKNIKQTGAPIIIDNVFVQTSSAPSTPILKVSDATPKVKHKMLKKVSKKQVLTNIKQAQGSKVIQDSSEQNPSGRPMPILITNDFTFEGKPKILKRASKEELLKNMKQVEESIGIKDSSEQYSSGLSMPVLITSDGTSENKIVNEEVLVKTMQNQVPVVMEDSSEQNPSDPSMPILMVCDGINEAQPRIVKEEVLENIKQCQGSKMIESSSEQNASSLSMPAAIASDTMSEIKSDFLKEKILEDIMQTEAPLVLNDSSDQNTSDPSIPVLIASDGTNEVKILKQEMLVNIKQSQEYIIIEDSSKQNATNLSMPVEIAANTTSEAKANILKKVSKEEALKNINLSHAPPVIVDSSEQSASCLTMPVLIATNGTSEAKSKILKRVSKAEALKNIKPTDAPVEIVNSSKQSASPPSMPVLIATDGTSEAKPKILKRVSKDEALKNIKLVQGPIVKDDASNQIQSALTMPILITNNGTSEAKILKKVSKKNVLKNIKQTQAPIVKDDSSKHNPSGLLTPLSSLSYRAPDRRPNILRRVTNKEVLMNINQNEASATKEHSLNENQIDCTIPKRITNEVNLNNSSDGNNAKNTQVIKPITIGQPSKNSQKTKHEMQENRNPSKPNRPSQDGISLSKIKMLESQSNAKRKAFKQSLEEYLKRKDQFENGKDELLQSASISSTTEVNSSNNIENASEPSQPISLRNENNEPTKETSDINTNQNLLGKNMPVSLPSATTDENEKVNVKYVPMTSLVTNVNQDNQASKLMNANNLEKVDKQIKPNAGISPKETSTTNVNAVQINKRPYNKAFPKTQNNFQNKPFHKASTLSNINISMGKTERKKAKLNTESLKEAIASNPILRTSAPRKKSSENVTVLQDVSFSLSNLGSSSSIKSVNATPTKKIYKETRVDLTKYTAISEMNIDALKSKLDVPEAISTSAETCSSNEPPNNARILSDGEVPKVILNHSNRSSTKPDENYEIFVDKSVMDAPIIRALMKQKLAQALERETNIRYYASQAQNATEQTLLQSVGVNKIADLDPKTQRIYREYKTMKATLKRLQSKADTMSNNYAEMKSLANRMKKLDKVPKLKNFVMNQILNCDNLTNKSTYTLDDKLFAFSLYLRDPTYYNYLETYFRLPKPISIKKEIAKLTVKPGIIDDVIKLIEILMQELNTHERLGILSYREVPIKPHLEYDKDNDRITGFADNGQERSQELSNFVQIFVLSGLNGTWRFIVAYNCCTNTMRVDGIVKFIQDIVKRSKEVHLRIVGIVNDYNSISVAAIGNLQRYTDVLDEVVPIYEPRKLVKCIRNLLIENDINFKYRGSYRTASWDDIMLAYNLDSEREAPYNFLGKITASHVNPKKIDKEKNSVCYQVFSLSMARAINYHYKLETTMKSGQKLEEHSLGTRDFCQFMNEFCDSFNADLNCESHVPTLIRIVTNKSCHQKFWLEAAQVANTFEFINNSCSRRFSVAQHFKATAEGFSKIASLIFKDLELRSFKTKHFNHEAINHFVKFVNDYAKDKNIDLTSGSFYAVLKHYMTLHLFSTGPKTDSYKVVRCLDKFKKVLTEKEPVPKVVDIPSHITVPSVSVTLEDMQQSLKTVVEFLEENVPDSYTDCESCAENYKPSEDAYDEIRALDLGDCERVLNYNKQLLDKLFFIYKFCFTIFADVMHEFDLIAKVKALLLEQIDFSKFKQCSHMERMQSKMLIDLPETLLKGYLNDLNKIIGNVNDMISVNEEPQETDYLI